MRPSPELTSLELFVQVYNGARAFSRFLGIGMRIDNKVRARAVFRQGLDFDVALAVFGNELVFFTPIESAHRASRDANWLTARSDFRRAVSSTNVGTPYGHAVMHVLQPMHVSWSILTIPVSSSLEIAPVGQFPKQAGASQWLHAIETL